jgi:hypothetical protein
MSFSSRRWATIAALLILLSFSSAPPARAEILSGCVAPEDAGVSHLVGWVDVGVMLGMADPEPPASLQVTDPDGSVINYRDGVGLIPPTEVLPIWFAPAGQEGDFELVINGEEHCTVTVGGSSAGTLTSLESVLGDWVPQSAPITVSP